MDSTGLTANADSRNQEPWQSWQSTARYLIVRLAQLAPWAWLAYLHHLPKPLPSSLASP
jgi:hypothetical protein